jgi:hypothetical protein
MARAYNIAAAALALEVSTKWLDNILSHNKLAGVRQKRQGVARQLSHSSLLVLAVSIRLTEDLGLPTGHAIRVATSLVDAGGEYRSATGIVLKVELHSFDARLTDRLASAVEVAPVPTRGRPPLNKTGRLD